MCDFGDGTKLSFIKEHQGIERKYFHAEKGHGEYIKYEAEG